MPWYSDFLKRFNERSTSPTAPALAQQYQMPRIDTEKVGSALGMYEYHPVVRMSADMIGLESSTYRLQARMRVDGVMKEVEDHPVIALIDDPNPIVSREELLYELFLGLVVTGNEYWFLTGRGEYPEEIWRIDARYMRVQPDPQSLVKGYWYEQGAVKRYFQHHEIIHFRIPSLLDYWYGAGIYGGLESDVRADYAAAEHLRSFLEQGGVPPGSWSVPGGISDDDFKEFKRYLEEEVRGKRRAPVFKTNREGKGIEFNPAGLNHQESQYVETRGFVRNRILDKARIPTGLLSETSTEAHARVAERLLVKYLSHLQRLVAAKLTKDLLPFFGGADEVSFSEVMTVDAQQLLWRRQAMDGIATLPEKRWHLFGWQEVDEKEIHNATSNNDSNTDSTPETDVRDSGGGGDPQPD